MDSKMDPKKISDISFNQTGTFFSLAHRRGFRIYKSDPLKLVEEVDLGAEIALVEMFYNSNIVAFVGSGSDKEYPPTTMFIYDFKSKSIICQVTFDGIIRSIKINYDKIFVVLDSKIYMHNQIVPSKLDESFKLDRVIETMPDKGGIFATSTEKSTSIIAFPEGNSTTSITVMDYNSNAKPVSISVCSTAVRCIALNRKGTILATTSQKGKSINCYRTVDGVHLIEFSRGNNYSLIYNMSFNEPSYFLSITSDHGTVHIFKMEDEPKLKELVDFQNCPVAVNNGFFRFIGNVVQTVKTMLKDIKSYSKLKSEETVKSLTMIDSSNNVIVVSISGKWQKGKIEEVNCTNIEKANL